MKSSCHFFLNHHGMPTKFSDSNSSVSVLHGTNLYSTNIYNSLPAPSRTALHCRHCLTVDITVLQHTQSSNHTLNLHQPTSSHGYLPPPTELLEISTALTWSVNWYSLRADSLKTLLATSLLLLRLVPRRHHPAMSYKHLPYCCMMSRAHALYNSTSRVHARTRRKCFHCTVAWRMR
jgi:hypothetical protein